MLEGCALALSLPEGVLARPRSSGLRFAGLSGPGASLLLVTCRDNPLRTFDRKLATSAKGPAGIRTAISMVSARTLSDGTPCVLFRKLRVASGRRLETFNATCAVRDFEYNFVLIPNLLPAPQERLLIDILAGAHLTRPLTPAVEEDVFQQRMRFALGALVTVPLLLFPIWWWFRRRKRARERKDAATDSATEEGRSGRGAPAPPTRRSSPGIGTE